MSKQVRLELFLSHSQIGLYVSSHNRLEDTNSLLQEITETQEGIQAIDVLREVNDLYEALLGLSHLAASGTAVLREPE